MSFYAKLVCSVGRTVYCERLIPTATHESVSKIFGACGKVTYVSLPRYKDTRDIKGFGFVEFATDAEACAAVERFRTHKSGTGCFLCHLRFTILVVLAQA